MRCGQLPATAPGIAAPRVHALRQQRRAARQALAAQCSQQQQQQQQPAAPQRQRGLLATLPTFLAAAAANLVAVLPASADAGKIFDFNLTMPIITAEFVLLMVFLEKSWFTPVGSVLDARDKFIREKLGAISGNSEIANLERECEETLSKARSEAAKLLEAAKSESTKEQQQKMEAAKAEFDAELKKAEEEIAQEEKDLLSNIDDIVDYVLNKTKEDLFSSPILSEAYAAGAVKGDLALPKGYSGQAPSGWEKP